MTHFKLFDFSRDAAPASIILSYYDGARIHVRRIEYFSRVVAQRRVVYKHDMFGREITSIIVYLSVSKEHK